MECQCGNHQFSCDVAFSFFDFTSSTLCCVGDGIAFLIFSSHVSLDLLYTSNDADSPWGVNYKSKKKTPTGFVSTFDRNLIQLARVQNATNFSKFFLQRILSILKENGQWHQEGFAQGVILGDRGHQIEGYCLHDLEIGADQGS